MKILILDDQPYLYMRFIVPAEEGKVIFAETPQQAEKALCAEQFDVLLLDGYLKNGTEGPDVLRDWRRRGFKLPPVFMISSSSEMQKRGIAAGAAGALSKQVIMEGDVDAVKRAVSGLAK